MEPISSHLICHQCVRPDSKVKFYSLLSRALGKTASLLQFTCINQLEIKMSPASSCWSDHGYILEDWLIEDLSQVWNLNTCLTGYRETFGATQMVAMHPWALNHWWSKHMMIDTYSNSVKWSVRTGIQIYCWINRRRLHCGKCFQLN